MPRLQPYRRYFASTAFDPSPLLQIWIVLGALILIALPSASWHHHAIGWLPYWLVLAPALSLALARRHRIAAALAEIARALLGRGRRRRKPGARRVTASRSPSARRATTLRPSTAV